MDERTLFDRFHEALEIEPRPGAYERMRLAMTNYPAAQKRRSASPIRWSKMGLRVAAVLAAAVLAVALGAGILALHFRPVGSVPAHADPNVTAYQAMMKSAHESLATASNFNCGGVSDPGCEAMVTATVPLLNKWASELKSFNTPARFALIDGMLQRHLADDVQYLNAMVAAHKAGNMKAFSFAFEGAFYEDAWIGPAVGAIDGSSPRLAGSYHDALALARQHIHACVGQAPGPADIACEQLYHPDECASVGAQACANDAHAAAGQLLSFLDGFTQNPAPSKLAARDGVIQIDLAKVDADIMAITDGLLSGDSAKTVAANNAYAADITSVDNEIGALLLAA
jgi:hypothetical protein